MFSPPPGGSFRQRSNIRPYKLAPIQREMFIQEAISDSPFYSTSAQYSDNTSDQKLPPLSTQNRGNLGNFGGSGSAASIPLLIMTDDGGDDWEVGSEVITLLIALFLVLVFFGRKNAFFLYFLLGSFLGLVTRDIKFFQ